MSPPSGKTEGLVLLDACCLINLFASGRVEEILKALPHDFAVARYVAEEEVLEIEAIAGEDSEDTGARVERVILRSRIAALIENGTLTKLEISSVAEQNELIRFASQLDDGEAHTLALALTRGGRVATDDKKAIRVAEDAWDQASSPAGAAIPCLRTSELLFEWANEAGIADPELAPVLRAITRRATFLPPKSDPHFERWMSLL